MWGKSEKEKWEWKKYKVCQVIKHYIKFHHPKTNLAKFGYIIISINIKKHRILLYFWLSGRNHKTQGIIQETFSASNWRSYEWFEMLKFQMSITQEVKLCLSTSPTNKPIISFFGLAYQGKDIVFRFIIEYSSLRDFGP